MIDDLLKDATDRMHKAVEAIRREFATVRTGRASPHILDRVIVDYYGAQTPLNQLAQISATEARLLTITPYDKSSIKAIEKAILESDVGLTPSNDGNVIRLTLPELTEERRKDLVRVVHKRMEEARVEIRNLRRDAADHLKREERDGGVGADESHRQLDSLQKTTDRHIAEVDRRGAAKEQEVLEV